MYININEGMQFGGAQKEGKILKTEKLHRYTEQN